jgi:hypothetical protein
VTGDKPIAASIAARKRSDSNTAKPTGFINKAPKADSITATANVPTDSITLKKA